MKECDRDAAVDVVAANTPSCAPLAWGYICVAAMPPY